MNNKINSKGISSVRLKDDTLYKFNYAKIKNRFRSGDDFILFLLSFFENNSKTIVKQPKHLNIDNPLE